eukprot:gene18484-17021_t
MRWSGCATMRSGTAVPGSNDDDQGPGPDAATTATAAPAASVTVTDEAARAGGNKTLTPPGKSIIIPGRGSSTPTNDTATDEGNNGAASTAVVFAALFGVFLLTTVVMTVLYFRKSSPGTDGDQGRAFPYEPDPGHAVQNPAFPRHLMAGRADNDNAGDDGVQQPYDNNDVDMDVAGLVDYAVILDEGAAEDNYVEANPNQPDIYDEANAVAAAKKKRQEEEAAKQQEEERDTGAQCARGQASGGRACKSPPIAGARFCENHTCKHSNCKMSKSSSEQFCKLHLPAGVRPRAPTGTRVQLNVQSAEQRHGTRRGNRKGSTYTGFSDEEDDNAMEC